ncbi:hypothetical protein B0H67DRAFT_561992, partial [Lasiosphaeris hirsuta]
DLRSNPPCHPRACAIQDCLSKNGFDEAKCHKFVDSLYECCMAFYERNGDGAATVTCPKANLLRLKVEQRKRIQ